MLNDAALTTGATAIKNEITHMQLHSTNVGGAWATGAVGSRVAVGSLAAVDADGDITWTNVPFTSVGANQAIGGVSYWTAATGGSNRGGAQLSGAADGSGGYTVTSVTETSTAV